MKISKTFNVTVEIDTEEAKSIKGGKGDWDAYPNWDINYLGEEDRFIEVMMDELTEYGKYSGIAVSVDEVRKTRDYAVRYLVVHDMTVNVLATSEEEALENAYDAALNGEGQEYKRTYEEFEVLRVEDYEDADIQS